MKFRKEAARMLARLLKLLTRSK